MLKHLFASVASLIALAGAVDAAPVERYELLLTEATYTTADQHELKYSSFVGDKETGSIYYCSGTVLLDQKTGYLKSHSGSCSVSFQAEGSHGDFSFSRISAIDASSKASAPKMDPAWGFWRIDQAGASHGFCTRFGSTTVVWRCFESPLPK